MNAGMTGNGWFQGTGTPQGQPIGSNFPSFTPYATGSFGGAPAGLTPQSLQMVRNSGGYPQAKNQVDNFWKQKRTASAAEEGRLAGVKQAAAQQAASNGGYAKLAKGGYAQGSILPAEHRYIGGVTKGSQLPSEYLGYGKDQHYVGGGNQGSIREVVTGGYGARPATRGRIGYRGELKARPGGLEEFYAKNAQSSIGKAASNQVDPRLGVVPRSRDVAANIARIAETPEEFPDHPGYGGAQKADLMRNYYAALQSNNPQQLQQATDAFDAFKNQLNSLRQQRARQAAQSAFQPQVLADGKDEVAKMQAAIPGMQQRAQEAFKAGGGYVDGGESENPPADDLPSIPSPQMMPKLAAGGNEEAVKPYIVNEEGPEAWQPEGGKPQLMPGKEKMVVFPKDGKVIPHGRTMKMLRDGKLDLPEHRAGGGIVSGAEAEAIANALARSKWWNPNLSSLNPTEWAQGRRSSLPGRARSLANIPEEYPSTGGNAVAERIAADNQAVANLIKEGKLKNTSHYAVGDSHKFIPEFQVIENPQEIKPGLRMGDLRQAEADALAQQESIMNPSPASPDEMAAVTADQQRNFMKQEQMPVASAPPPTNEPSMADWEASKQPALIGETIPVAKPSDADLEKQLLAEGLAMNARGIKQQGPSGVQFEAGGGIQNGKAYGANVVQPKVNIRPGKIFDEKGDVTGPRNEKEWVQKDKERWANEGKEMKNTNRTSSYIPHRQDGGSVKPSFPMTPAPGPNLTSIGIQKTPGFTSQGKPFGTFGTNNYTPMYNPVTGAEIRIGQEPTQFPIHQDELLLNQAAANAAAKQQMVMEQYAKEAMAARNAKRGRTAKYAK